MFCAATILVDTRWAGAAVTVTVARFGASCDGYISYSRLRTTSFDLGEGGTQFGAALVCEKFLDENLHVFVQSLEGLPRHFVVIETASTQLNLHLSIVVEVQINKILDHKLLQIMYRGVHGRL